MEKKYKKKLAVCVPTYQRPNEIKRIIEEEFIFFSRYSADLIIFDSSIDNQTKEIINSINNVIYISMPSELPSNEKVFKIYQLMMHDYEYVWIIHDHTIFNERVLKEVINVLDSETEYLFIKSNGNELKVRREGDINSLLLETAWLSTKYGAVILKSDCFLQGADWDYFKNKYLVPDKINFSQVGFYFERASQMENFNAIIIEFDRIDFVNIHSDRKIGWIEDVIRICTETWCSVIMALPDLYQNKMEVLKTQDRVFLSKYSLLSYKKLGVYNLNYYNSYKKWFPYINSVSRATAFLIATLPIQVANPFVLGKIVNRVKKAVKNQCSVCIYGAGKHGIECYDLLKSLDIVVDYFLVTRITDKTTSIDGIEICEVESFIANHNALVILAVASETQEEINQYLYRIGFFKNKKNKILSFC